MPPVASLPARLAWLEDATSAVPRRRLRLVPALLAPMVDAPPPLVRAQRLQSLALWRPTGLPVEGHAVYGRRTLGTLGGTVRDLFERFIPPLDPAIRGDLITELVRDAWVGAAAGAATAAQVGGHYDVVLQILFPTLPGGSRWMTTHLDDYPGGLPYTIEPIIGRLDAGGVGAITVDLDEDTNTVRLGNASFMLVNPGPAGPGGVFQQLMDSFAALPFGQLPVLVTVGFGGISTGSQYLLFEGVVDRWQVTRERVQVSAVPKTIQDTRQLSLTVRELIARVTHATGSSPFPDVPDESLDIVLPLHLNSGVAVAVPLIPVGPNTYLSGMGIGTINMVRDNGEALIHYPGDPLLVSGYPDVRYVPVATGNGTDIAWVIKLLYQVEEGHVISLDVNNFDGPFYFASSVPWLTSYSVSAYDATPRARHNLLGLNAGFELGSTANFIVVTGDAVADVVTFAVGTGKTHEGYHTLRVRSDNLTEVGEHRYTATVSTVDLNVESERAVHLSFWYTAGTFLLPGDPPDAQVSSQLSVQVNGGAWTVLPGSPGFDAMAEYSTTFVPAGGVVTLSIRCEGLTELKSADIYLDDFSIWAEEPVQPYMDNGVVPTKGMLYLFQQWLLSAALRVDVWSFRAVATLRPNWRFVSVITDPPDAWTLLNRMAQQLNAVLSKDREGYWRLDALHVLRTPVASFNPTANIVEDSFSRLSAPADNIYTSFYVDYSQDHGMVYLTPLATNIPDGGALVNACNVRAQGRGGDRELRVASDLILDKFTAIALCQANFTRYGFTGDVLQWRSWMDAGPILMLEQVLVIHPVLPFGEEVQAEVIGWHFLPDLMQIELVTRALPEILADPDASPAPIAHPILLATQAGIAVGVSVLLFVTPAPNTTLDPASILITGLAPGSAGGFAVSVYGSVVFTPTGGFTGIALALYTIADTQGNVSNAATITITVGVSAQLVVANPDTATTEMDTPVAFALLTNDSATVPGVLVPASVDLDPNTAGRQTTWLDPGHGTFTVDDLGTVTFTPVASILGDATAYYLVTDDLGHTSNLAKITVTVTEADEEELAQACNFVFGNDIDDPDVDGGNDTGIHIINAFCYFPEVDTVMACSGDPSMVGGTGAVPGPGFNDVYTSSRLGNSVMNPYTSFLGTIDVTSGGHGVCAMTNMLAYDGLLYVAVTTSLDSDQEVNGPPAVFTVDNITSLDDDSFYDTWVEAQEFATTFSRVGAMEQHNGNLYVALEPKLAGTNALAIWQFDGAAWSLQHSFGTSFSRLRAFYGVGAMLYAGVDGQLWYATAGTWAHAQTFTGAVDSLSFKDGMIYVNVRNGSNREIWRGSSDDNVFTLFHTFTGETGTLVGPMGTGMPHPDAVEGYLYVPVHEADGTKVYRWDGTEWTMDHDYGTDFLGVSTMLLTGQVLSLALPRRLHTSDPGGGNVPGCEIWGVNCYYPPTWDLTYDVAIVDFTSLITDEVIPAPPDATWDVATLSLDNLEFPELDLTLSVGIDGVITGDRTDTSYGGPYTTTYRCDDSLGRHWAGTFSITFIAG